jgi:hypothetical protein
VVYILGSSGVDPEKIRSFFLGLTPFLLCGLKVGKSKIALGNDTVWYSLTDDPVRNIMLFLE